MLNKPQSDKFILLSNIELTRKIQRSSIDEFDVNEYENIIQNLICSGSKAIIPNSNISKAAIIVKYILKETKKQLYIYTTSLAGQLSNDKELMNEVDLLLKPDRNIDIRILIDEQNAKTYESKLYQKINTHFTNNNTRDWIKKTNQASKTLMGNNFRDNVPYHFIVSDGKRYRLEQNNENDVAICCFNDPMVEEGKEDNSFTKHLQSAFIKSFNQSSALT